MDTKTEHHATIRVEDDYLLRGAAAVRQRRSGLADL
jgi:hypothetical protein